MWRCWRPCQGLHQKADRGPNRGQALSGTEIAAASRVVLRALITAAGAPAKTRFLEFFGANISNPDTRRADAGAALEFLAWCADRGVPSIAAVQPLHIAAWIEQQAQTLAAPSVKQRLAALRHLFDWLVTGQVLPVNPAASVRGPSHVVRQGKTPVHRLSQERRHFREGGADGESRQHAHYAALRPPPRGAEPRRGARYLSPCRRRERRAPAITRSTRSPKAARCVSQYHSLTGSPGRVTWISLGTGSGPVGGFVSIFLAYRLYANRDPPRPGVPVRSLVSALIQGG